MKVEIFGYPYRVDRLDVHKEIIKKAQVSDLSHNLSSVVKNHSFCRRRSNHQKAVQAHVPSQVGSLNIEI